MRRRRRRRHHHKCHHHSGARQTIFCHSNLLRARFQMFLADPRLKFLRKCFLCLPLARFPLIFPLELNSSSASFRIMWPRNLSCRRSIICRSCLSIPARSRTVVLHWGPQASLYFLLVKNRISFSFIE